MGIQEGEIKNLLGKKLKGKGTSKFELQNSDVSSLRYKLEDDCKKQK